MLGIEHGVERRLQVRQHPPHFGQVLAVVLAGVEDVQDQGGKKTGGALIPEVEVAGLQAQRIDQDADDVLDVGHLHPPLADLEQRVPTDRIGVGRIELDAMGEGLAPIDGDLPKLPLAVVDERGFRPGRERRNDVARALAAARRADDDGGLVALVDEQSAAEAAEHPARIVALLRDQLGLEQISRLSPGVRAKAPDLGLRGCHLQGRHGDRDGREEHGQTQAQVAQIAQRMDMAVGLGPPEPGPRPIDPEHARAMQGHGGHGGHGDQGGSQTDADQGERPLNGGHRGSLDVGHLWTL